MPNLTTQKIIEHLNSTLERDVPFPLSDMSKAIEKSAMEGDEESLERLLYSMKEAFIRLNPDKPRKAMIISAHENLATLAYIADHKPDPLEWTSVGPENAYKHDCDYGKAMSLVRQIFARNGIDVNKDVYEKD